ncbi:MAG: Integrator complex subunit 9 [Marteilia pararefringens]
MVQFYYISPISSEILEMASNMPEWLSKSRMNQIHFGADSCFQFSQMLKSGKLQCFKTVVDIKKFNKFSVVFAPHSSLHFGTIVDLLNLFPYNSTTILTDPLFRNYCTKDQILDLLYQGIVHHCYIECLLDQSKFDSIMSALNICKSVACIPGEILSLKAEKNSIRVYQSVKSLQNLHCNIISLQADALKTTRDLIIDINCEEFKNSSQLVTYGKASADQVLNSLVSNGFINLRCEHSKSSNSTVIYADNDEILINVDQNSIHIICTSTLESLNRAKKAVISVCNRV